VHDIEFKSMLLQTTLDKQRATSTILAQNPTIISALEDQN